MLANFVIWQVRTINFGLNQSEPNHKKFDYYKKVLSFPTLRLWLAIWLVLKSINFATLIVAVPHVPKLQALAITNVAKFGMCQFVVANIIIYYNCCTYWMKKWMKSELISIIVDHIQWQIENIFLNKFRMYYWAYITVFSCKCYYWLCDWILHLDE